MVNIALIYPSDGSVSDLFLKIRQLFASELIAMVDLTAADLSSVSLVLIDLNNHKGDELSHLRTVLAHYPKLVRIGLVQFSSRQQIVQAKAIGVSEIWERNTSIEDALAALKCYAGDYAIPELDEAVPQATRFAINGLCRTLDDVAVASVLEKPIPMKRVSQSARDVLAALNADGLGAWLTAVQSHHSHTFCHSMMVAGYVAAFSSALGLDVRQRGLLNLGAILHDLGKVKIPLSILDKPGPLTPEEFDIVKKHPQHSADILKQRSEVEPIIRDMALHHHEYLDGSGYPHGLAGNEISPFVRTLTICDIFSALTEKRAYKDIFGERQAYQILLDMRNKIDQDLLRKFRPIVLEADVGALKQKTAGGCSHRVSSRAVS